MYTEQNLKIKELSKRPGQKALAHKNNKVQKNEIIIQNSLYNKRQCPKNISIIKNYSTEFTK